jgi:hypothetical protein
MKKSNAGSCHAWVSVKQRDEKQKIAEGSYPANAKNQIRGGRNNDHQRGHRSEHDAILKRCCPFATSSAWPFYVIAKLMFE